MFCGPGQILIVCRCCFAAFYCCCCATEAKIEIFLARQNPFLKIYLPFETKKPKRSVTRMGGRNLFIFLSRFRVEHENLSEGWTHSLPPMHFKMFWLSHSSRWQIWLYDWFFTHRGWQSRNHVDEKWLLASLTCRWSRKKKSMSRFLASEEKKANEPLLQCWHAFDFD